MLAHILQPLAIEKTLDFWSKELGLMWTVQQPMARIVKRHNEAKDTVSLWLKPNSHFKGFKTGQHINVTLQVNGVNFTRSYSLSEAPRADGLLRITIKKEGKVSSHLCQHVHVGDSIEISQAFGELQLNAQKTNLFLASGSGITPVMSLLHTATMQQPITLLYWEKNRADLCFMAELNNLAAKNPLFKFYIFLTQEQNLLQGELKGRIDTQAIIKLIPNLVQHQVVACGGQGFIEAVQLLKPYVDTLQVESFSPIKLNTANTQLGTVRVELKASHKVLELNQGDSLLDALEAQGIYPPSGYRMGICHSCSCQKISGTTQDLQTGELASESHSAVKLCVNRAYSDLVLDI
jgi:ferredoxin-NADP reductase